MQNIGQKGTDITLKIILKQIRQLNSYLYAISNIDNSQNIQADQVNYNNLISGLSAVNTQEGIDENAFTNVIAGQNQLILGAFLNNGFFEQHEFKVFETGGQIVAEVWNKTSGWDIGVTYKRGQSVIYNFIRYNCLVDNNIGNQPDISPTQWNAISQADFNLHGFIAGTSDVYTLNTTTSGGTDGHAQVTLTAGTDALPVLNYVWAELDGSLNLVLKAGTTLPNAPIIILGDAEVASVATTASQGLVNQHRFTNSLYNEDLFTGQMETLREKARRRVQYKSGVTPTLTIITNPGSLDDVIFTTTLGLTKQLWYQMFPAFTGSPVYYCLNHPTNPITTPYTDLNELDVDANGVTLRNNNDRYRLRIYGNQSSGTDSIDALYVVLPNGKYSTDQNALLDVDKYDVLSIGGSFSSTFFNIGVVVLHYQTSSNGTITNLVGGTNVQDTRGDVLGTQTGGSGGTSGQTNFSDADFLWYNATDPTKIAKVDASNISTGIIRTYGLPDADGMLTFGDLKVHKIINETKVNDDTPTLDNDLQLELEADSRYLIILDIFYSGDSTPDIKIDELTPLASTGSSVYTFSSSSNSGGFFTSEIVGACVGTLNKRNFFRRTILKTVGAGTYGVMWSQNISDSGQTILWEGSIIRAIKLN